MKRLWKWMNPPRVQYMRQHRSIHEAPGWHWDTYQPVTGGTIFYAFVCAGAIIGGMILLFFIAFKLHGQ